MEHLLYIKYVNNLINLGIIEGNQIKQLEILKSKIILLISDNSLVQYDIKSEQFITRKPLQDEGDISQIKIYSEQVYIIVDKFLKILDPNNNLQLIKEFDIGEKLYTFCLFEEYKNFNLEIIYVNFKNELKYFSRGYLFDTKYRNLYKENTKIDKVLFINGLLMWTSNLTIKVFDLEKKRMIMRKTFDYVKDHSVKGANIEIDFLIFNQLLCLNVKQKMILVYKLPEVGDGNGNDINPSGKQNTSTNTPSTNGESQKPIEIFKYQEPDESCSRNLIIGMWINSALTKISILKSMSSTSPKKNSEQQLNYIKLEIFKLTADIKKPASLTEQKNAQSDELSNEIQSQQMQLMFEKDFSHIASRNNFNFQFSDKYTLVYIYDSIEIFVITLQDKIQKLFDDLKNIKTLLHNQASLTSNFNFVFEIFAKLPINEKIFVINKLLRNLNTLLTMKTFDESKLIYMIHSLIGSSDSQAPILFESIIQLLMQTNLLEYCYSWVSRFFNLCLTDEIKEKLFFYFLERSKANEGCLSFRLLIKMLNEVTDIKLTEAMIKYFQPVVISSSGDIESISINDRNSYENNEIYIYSLVHRKNKAYSASIDLLLKINRIDEIYETLAIKGNEELIFRYDILFALLTEEQLLNVLDVLFNKDTELLKCNLFYEKLFQVNANGETEKGRMKLINFTSLLIQHEKGHLVIDSSKAAILFNIILRYVEESSSVPLLMKFLKLYDKFDYKKILKANEEILFNNKKYIDVLVALLSNMGDYQRIINIYLDTLLDPEKCIQFLENTNITEVKKDEMYAYLKTKIKESSALSSTKKFYFISLFQDDVLTQENQEILLLEELTNSSNSTDDDMKFILLILEQLNLKVRILDISKSISKGTLDRIIKEFQNEAMKGKKVRLNEFFKCCYYGCDQKIFSKGDDILCFKSCFHMFHKRCFVVILNENNIYGDALDYDITYECKICSKL